MELEEILANLDAIDKKLDIILERLHHCETSCKKMDDHISFVEETYTTLRTPLDYMKNMVNSITGDESHALPKIE